MRCPKHKVSQSVCPQRGWGKGGFLTIFRPDIGGCLLLLALRQQRGPVLEGDLCPRVAPPILWEPGRNVGERKVFV